MGILCEKTILPIYRHLNIDVKPWKEAIKVLEEMKNKGIIVALITNGNSEVQRNKIRLLGIEYLFDKVYISDDFTPPIRKPSTVTFRLFFEDFSLQPSFVVHIGDDEELDGSCAKIRMKFIKVSDKTDWCKIEEILKNS